MTVAITARRRRYSLPSDAVELIEAAAAENGVAPAALLAGECGHALVLAPNVAAERLRAVELATGFAAGGILGRILCDLMEEWQREPGGLQRWMDQQFEFSGPAEENAQIARALFTLETAWRFERMENSGDVSG